MQKDVLYIDVEDDITAIIGKIKASKRHIVALVPPKRIGAIQSAVNLKLVHRAAEQADKRLVIISSNAALMALAGSAGIPVAKTLQSKPELAEIPVLDVDDGNDVIDGSSLEAAPHPHRTSKKVTSSEDAVVDEIESSEKDADADVASSAAGTSVVAARNKPSIPDFDSFRRKLFVGIALLVLLSVGLVWALVFAPRASVVIVARTTDVALNSNVKIGPELTTDLKAGTIKAEIKTSKKEVSIPFTASGKKDVGEKATGTVKFVPTNPMIFLSGATIPAGTKVTAAGGSVYYTDQTVLFDSDAPASSLAAGKLVGVTAAANGAAYNGATGSASGPSGFSTSFTTATTGGTDKTITIVTQEDVDKVSGDILKTGDSDAAKAELKKQLGADYVVLDNTFVANTDGVKPSPAVDTEAADTKGSLIGSVTFSLVGIKKSEINSYLDAYFAQQIDGKNNQKIYANGAAAVSFTTVTRKEGAYTATISTNGKVGPRIDEQALKEYVKGKRIGEIQTHIQGIQGVDSVDVKLSPFWVNTVPGDLNKIAIEFKVND